MKTLKSLTALSLGALCLAFNTQVIAKEATPPISQIAINTLNKINKHLKTLPINVRFGLRSCLPHDGHFKAWLLTWLLHSGQLINAIILLRLGLFY